MAVLYRVRATLTYGGGGPGLSTTYHRSTAPPSLAAAQAASDRVRGSWDVVKSILHSSMTVSMQASVDLIDEVDGALVGSFGTVPLANVVGTGPTSQGPPQVMAGLVLNTSQIVAGRRLKGHLNIGPLSSGQSNQPTPNAGTVTAVNAMGVALVTVSPPATTAPLVVWHRPKRNKATHALISPGLAADVTSSSCALRFFTLRSRRD